MSSLGYFPLLYRGSPPRRAAHRREGDAGMHWRQREAAGHCACTPSSHWFSRCGAGTRRFSWRESHPEEEAERVDPQRPTWSAAREQSREAMPLSPASEFSGDTEVFGEAAEIRSRSRLPRDICATMVS